MDNAELAGVSQEQFDQICEVMRGFAAAIGELCDQLVQAWARMVKAIAEAFRPLLEWASDVAIELKRHAQRPTITHRAPRTLGRHNAMRTRRVRQWRWSPMYGRR